MNPALTLSFSINCTLADLNRQQIYILPLVSITMPLPRWRQLKRDVRALIRDIGQFVTVAAAIGEVICKSAAWGVGWL